MRLLTARQVASEWQMPLARVYELARLRMLPVVRIGRQVRFSEDALRELISRGGSTQRTAGEGALDAEN